MDSNMIKSVITGVGGYLPNKILTNSDLEKLVETKDEWIVERTGIKKRHIADGSELTSDLATRAAEKAIFRAGLKVNDIDLIVLATTTPDNTFPSTAVSVQQKLGIKNCAAFDVQAVCTGFVYALSVADSLIKNGGFKNALVIGAETISRIVDWSDRGTCILFGDGAGAVVLSAHENTERGILGFDLHSDSETKDILYTDGGVSSTQEAGFLRMSGQEVFKHAVVKLAQTTETTMQKCGITTEQINWVIPHQANQRILDATIKKLGVPSDKLISTVADHGNTSAASIPLALDVAVQTGKIKEGDILAIQAIGGGLTWGSVIIRF
jgi:3-oxoacyl-[acyl-carrier-protein] synthase-3